MPGSHPVTVTIDGEHRGPVVPEDFAGADPWTVTLRRDGRTLTVPFYTGPGLRDRMADGLTDTRLSEINNVGYLAFTQQLRDYSDYAQQTGRRFDLYTRPVTILSGPLQNAINSGRINRLDIPK